MTLPRTKPVVFVDWYGTLSDQFLWHSFKEGSPKERHVREEIMRLFFKKPNEIREAWQRGEMTSEALVDDIAKTLQEDHRLLWYRFEDDLKTTRFSDVGLLDALHALRTYACVVLATDSGDSFHGIVERLRLREMFDDILTSADRGATKQDVRAFFANYQEPFEHGHAFLIDDKSSVCDAFSRAGGSVFLVGRDGSTRQGLSEALKWARAQPYV